MAAQSPPFVLQNSSHSAAVFRQAAFSPWLGGGVMAPAEYAVTAQSTPNMSVQIAAGRAWIPGTQVANISGQSFSTQAAYFGLNDAPATVTIATANATNPRIDLVYVAVQDSFYSGATNATVLGVVTGTPAASPVAPAAPSNALTLATVAVAANATSITNGNITQTPAASLLTVTRGGVDPVLSTTTTAGLYVDQYRGHPTYKLQRWNGSAWGTPRDIPTFSTIAARNTFYSTTNQPPLERGAQCVCLGATMTYDGTAWRFTLSGIYTATTDANGFFTIPHGGGQAPFGWVIAAGYQGVDSSNFGVKVLTSTNAGDATNLGGRAILNGAYYSAGQSVGVTWMAQF